MTVTTCGWFRRATARASRRKRSIWSSSPRMSACSSLMATQRSSVSSNARYTVDMPPEPTRSSSRKRPLSRVPIISSSILGNAVAVCVRYFTDPACSWSWGIEPVVRRLMVEFADSLSWTYVMDGLARELDPAAQRRLSDEWLDVADESGMPLDPRLWREGPIASTYPACMAVKAAAEQSSDGGYAYLRALREGLFCF